jgi:hypothetical protein
LLLSPVGGEARHHLDEAVLRSFLLQPGAPGPVRAGVQPGELHAPVRAPRSGGPLVGYQHLAEAREDRCKDSLPLQDDDIPDGGGRCPGEAVPVDAFQDPPPRNGLSEGSRLEFVKDGGRKEGRLTCGITVPGQRRTKRLGGHMTRSGDEFALNSSHPRQEGPIVSRILALEAVNDGCRLREKSLTPLYC